MRACLPLAFTVVLAVSLACRGGSSSPGPYETSVQPIREPGPPPPPELCEEAEALAVCEALGSASAVRAALPGATVDCVCVLTHHVDGLELGSGKLSLTLGKEGEAKREVTPLYWAAKKGEVDTVAPLVEAGAHPDQRNPGELDTEGVASLAPLGRVPLDAAIWSDDIEMVHALVRQGADVGEADLRQARAPMLLWLLEHG